VQTLTKQDVLEAITTDLQKFSGAAISTIKSYSTKEIYQNSDVTWTQSTDGTMIVPYANEPRRLTGKFYMRGQYTTNGNSADSVQILPFFNDADNCIGCQWYDSGHATYSVELYKRVAASQTSLIDNGAVISDTNEHYVEFTRDVKGNFELFVDGVSKGTATDTYMPDPLKQSSMKFLDSAGGSVFTVKEVRWDFV